MTDQRSSITITQHQYFAFSPATKFALESWLRAHELELERIVDDPGVEVTDTAVIVDLYLHDDDGKPYFRWDDGQPLLDAFEKRQGHELVIAKESKSVELVAPLPANVLAELGR